MDGRSVVVGLSQDVAQVEVLEFCYVLALVADSMSGKVSRLPSELKISSSAISLENATPVNIRHTTVNINHTACRSHLEEIAADAVEEIGVGGVPEVDLATEVDVVDRAEDLVVTEVDEVRLHQYRSICRGLKADLASTRWQQRWLRRQRRPWWRQRCTARTGCTTRRPWRRSWRKGWHEGYHRMSTALEVQPIYTC